MLVEGKKNGEKKNPHEMLGEKRSRSRNAEKENAIKEKALNRILSQTCIILFMAFCIFIFFLLNLNSVNGGSGVAFFQF